jgi:photosystem II stability/assembly factor-like uncharacterized protein
MKKCTLFILTLFFLFSMSALGQLKVDSIAKIDDYGSIYGSAANNIAYSKTNNVLHIVEGSELLNSAGTALANGKLFYLYSTNNGATWGSVGPINSVNNQTYYSAIAVSDAGAPFIVYRGHAARGIFLITADDYTSATAGLFNNSKLLSDTARGRSNEPNVVVSGDGKNVIVSYTIPEGSKTSYTKSSIAVVVSSDGGKTFSSEKKIFDFADVYKLYPYVNQNLQQSSVAIGKNGYCFALAYAVADTSDTYSLRTQRGGVPYSPIYSVSTDYGETWSKPQWIPMPVQTDPINPAWVSVNNWPGLAKVILDDNNVPHITFNVYNPIDLNALCETHLSGTKWVSSLITPKHEENDMESDATQLHSSSLSIDKNGYLYALYTDRTGRHVNDGRTKSMVSVSKDGGNTWLQQYLLKDYGTWVYGIDAPNYLNSNKIVCLTINDNTTPRALLFISVPVDSALKQPPMPRPKIITNGGYSATSSAYNWVDITTTGTQITAWKNGLVTSDSAKDDGYSANSIPLGFDFTFYGKKYNKLYVGINGLVSFTQQYLNRASQAEAGVNPDTMFNNADLEWNFPGTANLPQTIAFAYYDWTMRAADGFPGSKVYYKSTADQFILSFEGIGSFDTGDQGNTFQLILKNDNTMTVQFKKLGLSANYANLKIGIQDNDSTGVTWVKTGYPIANILKDGSAVTFKSGGSSGETITKNMNLATEIGLNGTVAKGLLFKPGKLLDNGSTIWLCGHEKTGNKNSYTFVSTDGGKSFTQSTMISGSISNVDAFSKTTAIVATADGKILKTTDGGKTWVQKHIYTLPSGAGFFDGMAIAGDNVVAYGDGEAGNDMYFCRSTDKGETFTQIPQTKLNYGTNLYGYFTYGSCMAAYGNSMWCATYGSTGTNGYVVRTNDGGATWKSTELTTASRRFVSISFKSEKEGMGIDNVSDLFYTADSGKTWTKTTKPTGGTSDTVAMYGISGVPNSTLFIAQGIFQNGKNTVYGIYYTNNNGASWTQIPAPLTPRGVSLIGGMYLDANTGYAFSNGGWVLKLGTATPSIVKEEGTLPTSYTLYQNYPNPFNPTTTIMYDIPKNSKVVLKIYNSLGQEVKTLVDGFQNTGKYTVTFDASSIASGVYFYRLTTDSYTNIKKMMFIK